MFFIVLMNENLHLDNVLLIIQFKIYSSKLQETEERRVSTCNPRINDNLQDEARVEGSSNEENIDHLIVPCNKNR